MVTERDQIIIIQPNRSASWQQNKWLLWLLGGWILLVAAGFALAGAWLIIPFAGLEIAGLAAGLYYVCWKLNHQHVVRFSAGAIIVEKGSYFPKHRWVVPQCKAFLSVEQPGHDWDAIRIFVCGGNEAIALGDFLNKDESTLLLASLQRHGLPTRNHSPGGQSTF